MNVTTQDVIRILPFDDAFKERLLSQWDSYSADQRFNLEQIVWDTYSDLYQIRLDTNTQIAFQELSEGKEFMDKDLGLRVREKTDKEFEQMFQQHVPAADLADTREKLQDLIENAVNNGTSSVQETQNNEVKDPSSNPSD